MNILYKMPNCFKNLKKKLYILIILLLVFNTSYSNSEIYNKIIVNGNERISTETIIMFSDIKIGENLEIDQLNDTIKKLYKTNYFKNVQINTQNDIITISVQENPIIQSIAIKGVKNKDILKQLSEITKRNEKYPYLKNKIKEQRDLLINIVRNYGFYFANLETNLINNKNNSVDILFNFNLGERAIIKKINFNGKKIFRDNKLRNIIKSEEGKIWKFLTSNKYLNERRIKNDEDLLKKYYRNKGFYNVVVKSSYAKNIDNKYFELNYNIDAGEKYFFNDFTLSFSDNFNNESLNKISKITKKIKRHKILRKNLK